MTGQDTSRLPSDPRHPDHAMYKGLLAGVSALDHWDSARCANLAAALYADLRGKQPRMSPSDLGRVLAGDPRAANPSVFAAPRDGYHAHSVDPSVLVFSARVADAERPLHETLAPFARYITIDDAGYLTEPGIVRSPISRIAHASMLQVNGVVLHRTESSTAASTLSTWRTREAGTGAHFLIDRDGTIHQTVSIDRQAWHVGAIRSRGEVEATITNEDQRELDAARNGQVEWRGTAVRAVSRVESTRPYPERYPTNADSIGIEVVGRYRPATQDWEPASPEQLAALQRLMGSLKRNLGITDEDVYQHDAISRKTPGEGAGLYPPAPPDLVPADHGPGRVPVAAPQR